MGYFPNGAEGMDYQEQYCVNCVHDIDCAVWGLHLAYSYKLCNEPENFLNALIPRDKRGYNEKCKMFYENPNTKG